MIWRYDLAARSWRFEDSTDALPAYFVSVSAYNSGRDTIVVYGQSV